MEELSDDDAKHLASDWVKRIQNSVLASRDDVKSSAVVRAPFVSSDERSHTNHRFNEIRKMESPVSADSQNYVSSDQLPALAGASGHSNQHVSTFERASKQSNVGIDRSSANLTTPDADFLRQKRLAFFNRSEGLQGKEDFSFLRDRNRNISKDTCASWIPPCKRKGSHSSNIELFDCCAGEYRHDSCRKQEEGDHMHYLRSSGKRIPHSLGDEELHYRYRPFRAQESEEDELRLELWGLKEAVYSGELNLNAYLSEPSRKGNRFIPASSHHSASIGADHPVNTPCQPLQNEAMPLHRKFSREGYNQSYALDDFGNETREDDHSNPLLNGKTHLSEISNGTHFNGPEPQINGPLYCGFENSDSETSLLSFGSKCDDVHFRKVEKMSPRAKGNPENKKQGHKIKQKRGKDKILLELTEFIEGCGSPKESSKNCQGNDRHLRCPSDVMTASDTDILNEIKDDYKGNQFGKRDDAISSQRGWLYNSRINSDNHEPSLDRQPMKDTLVPTSESQGNVMGKICPTCDEVNSKAANWCIECGTALICIQLSCLTAEQRKVFEKQCEETQALIKETLKTPMNFSCLSSSGKAEKEERVLINDISSLSLKVSQSTSNLEETKHWSSPDEYKRRWVRSSIAWSTYHPSELAKSRSFVKDQGKRRDRQRATSFSDLTTFSSKEKEKGSKHHKTNIRNKPVRKRTVSCSSFGGDQKVMETAKGFTNLKSIAYGQNTSSRDIYKGKQMQASCSRRGNPSIENKIQSRTSIKRPEGDNLCNGLSTNKGHSHHRLYKSSSSSSVDDQTEPFKSEKVTQAVPPLNLQDVHNYDKILTLIRSQRDSEPVPYLYLPDEILLRIFALLPHKDLVSCSQVCSQFYRISMDETLWKVIVLRKNNDITDEWLRAIGKRKPVSLTISQCHSDKVTAEGLRDLFRSCSDSLEELHFSRCRGGELIGESVLLHLAARCCWLRSVDASWSNVSDIGVQAVVDNVKRLECLCLNGCQAVSDKSIKCMANKHGKTLRIFEVFGCFNITPAGIEILGQTCKKLQTLNIGQCHKITDSAIGALVSNLPELENLDLRGCKQVRDSAVKKIVRHCPFVTTLALANCPLITDVSLAEIATYLPRIRSLDICGCSRVSDNGICALSKSCRRLELLDLTSTGVGRKSVLSLANYCSQSLCNLKLSFCTDISDDTVVHLAKHCKRLTTLHLYGCKRIRNASDLKLLNPALTIEFEP